MNYKFKEVRLNLERDEVEVLVAFQEKRNRWQIKSYKYDAKENEIDIDDLIETTKKLIDGANI
jgi:hypothetical protein